MLKVSLRSVDEVTKSTLKACNVCDESIKIILDSIHYANRSGIPTHGLGRLPLYVNKIRGDKFNPNEEIKTIIDNEAMAVMDARGGFGQVAAMKAVDIAITKAKKFGISIVGVRNSNNFGAAGFFGEYAAKNGMASIIFANAAPAIAPTGGSKPLFGTNPICYSFPGTDGENPIVLDMATSVIARGKIRLAAKNGEKIPFGCALDQDGNPTDDPNKALLGSLLPIAGYKGYGLALFVDIFAGLLTGSAYAGEVKPLSKMDEESKNGHLFILIDVKKFLSDEEIKERVKVLYEAVKSCGEEGEVLLPGEPGYINMEKQKEYIFLSKKQYEEVNNIAASVGVRAKLEVI